MTSIFSCHLASVNCDITVQARAAVWRHTTVTSQYKLRQHSDVTQLWHYSTNSGSIVTSQYKLRQQSDVTVQAQAAEWRVKVQAQAAEWRVTVQAQAAEWRNSTSSDSRVTSHNCDVTGHSTSSGSRVTSHNCDVTGHSTSSGSSVQDDTMLILSSSWNRSFVMSLIVFEIS